MKRGRKSAAELTVIVGNFGHASEDGPPEGLTDRQCAIWRSVIASEARGLFSTAVLRGMLADYCCHRESAEKISEVIATFKPEWLKAADGAKRYAGLIRMREIETRAAASMATKLRLTNQSRYTPQAAATAAKNSTQAARPWES